MAKPLVLDLHIPYCIRPENYLAHFNAVGSNAEKNAYMDALKREVLSYEGELDGYEIRAVHLSGGSASVMAPDLLGDVLRTVRTICRWHWGQRSATTRCPSPSARRPSRASRPATPTAPN